MPAITFPFEIKETILEILAEDDKGHLALKTCSLVCQAFLPMCRKHIFKNIILNHHDPWHNTISPTGTSLAFERLLRESPEIADYIRKLDYTILIADLTSLIQESLKRISRLEFLSVRYHYLPGLDWSNNPIHPALLHLLRLPTFTHFKMVGINSFVVSDLIPCVNLEQLDISICTTVSAETTFHLALPERSIQLHKFVSGTQTSATIMKLCSARRSDGQPIIDFGSLSKITVTLIDRNGGKALQEFFRRCHALTNAHILLFNDPRDVRQPGLSDILRPSMQTLKHLVVNMHVFNDSDKSNDSLLGITSEFEDMCSKNIIETVSIQILVFMLASFRLGDVRSTSRLDEILTSPGWFPLKRVSLVIGICSDNGGLNELEALQNFPGTRFPRLSSSNSVSLDINLKVTPN